MYLQFSVFIPISHFLLPEPSSLPPSLSHLSVSIAEQFGLSGSVSVSLHDPQWAEGWRMFSMVGDLVQAPEKLLNGHSVSWSQGVVAFRPTL